MALTELFVSFLIFFSLFVRTSRSAENRRGINPAKESLYPSSGSFKCLDGSMSIKAAQINDDYCDCPDSSDEPGTAACAEGKFFCVNKGFKPLLLSSSRVDDGICDCCDGSDEKDVSCTNTCDALGAEARAAILAKKLIQEQGWTEKSRLISEAKVQKEGRSVQLVALKAQLTHDEASLSQAQASKDAAESPEKSAKDNFDADWTAKTNAHKELAQLTLFEYLDTDKDGTITKMEIVSLKEFDKDKNGEVSSEEAEDYLDLDGDGQLNATEAIASMEHFKTHLYESFSNVFKESPASHIAELMQGPGPKPDFGEDIRLLIQAADSARKNFNDLKAKKERTATAIRDIEKDGEIDFGPDDEFLPFLKQCHEIRDREYKYKLCVFDKVTQEPLNGGRSTSLGTWGQWSGVGANKYSEMTYTNGEKCWNGPNRSMKVSLVCHNANEVVSVSEPNRCEYAMTFKTPMACKQPKPASSHEEL